MFMYKCQHSFSSVLGTFNIDKVAPQANGESSKVKVKVRVNIHGIFLVSSASMVEKLDVSPEEEEKNEENAKPAEAMDVENGPKGAGEPNGETEAQKEEPVSRAENGASILWKIKIMYTCSTQFILGTITTYLPFSPFHYAEIAQVIHNLALRMIKIIYPA